MSYDGLTLSVRVILHALDLLELSGEYREGDRLDGEFIRRLLARESVQVILLRIEQQLEQGASPESIASHIAGEYGAFLRDAVIAVLAEEQLMQEYEESEYRLYEPASAEARRNGSPRTKAPSSRNEVVLSIEGFPETAREEANRFLTYLENRMRDFSQCWIHALLELLNMESLESLMESLKVSPCVRYYSQPSEYLVVSQSEFEDWLTRHSIPAQAFQELAQEFDLPDFPYRYFHAYKDSVVESLFEYTLFSYEYKDASPSIGGFFYSEFLLPHSACALRNWVEIYEGELFVRSENACGRCESCYAMEKLIQLCIRTWNLFPFWIYPEACSFIFKGTPLPRRVGHAFHYDLDAFRTEARSKDSEQEKNFRSRFTVRTQLVQLPNIEIRCLPILSAEAFTLIQQHSGLFADPRQLALYLHDYIPLTRETENGRFDIFPVLDGTHSEPPPLRRDLRKLLADWNRLAPSEWRYTTRSAKVNFCRALHRAKRALSRLAESV